MGNMEWTVEQIDLLRSLAPTSITYTDIAERISALGIPRSVHSVQHKALKLGFERFPDKGVVWAGERNELLLKWWAEGISAGVIAERLGATRNAVMGRIHRLGLQRGHGATVKVERKPKPKQVGERRVSQIKRAREERRPKIKAVNVTVKPTPAEIHDALIPFEQRKQLVDLGPNDCRWPVGDVGEPGFFFCGGKTADGCSYCPGHTYRATEHNIRNRHYARAA